MRDGLDSYGGSGIDPGDIYAHRARLPAEPDFDAGVRHFGTDAAAHHRPYDDGGERCLHCFELLDDEGLCRRCDDEFASSWVPEGLAHPRNAQEALLALQYVEFRALFEDD